MHGARLNLKDWHTHKIIHSLNGTYIVKEEVNKYSKRKEGTGLGVSGRKSTRTTNKEAETKAKAVTAVT